MLSHWTFWDLAHLENENHNHNLQGADEVEVLSQDQLLGSRVSRNPLGTLPPGGLPDHTLSGHVRLAGLVLVGILRTPVLLERWELAQPRGRNWAHPRPSWKRRTRVQNYSAGHRLQSHFRLSGATGLPIVHLPFWNLRFVFCNKGLLIGSLQDCGKDLMEKKYIYICGA